MVVQLMSKKEYLTATSIVQLMNLHIGVTTSVSSNLEYAGSVCGYDLEKFEDVLLAYYDDHKTISRAKVDESIDVSDKELIKSTALLLLKGVSNNSKKYDESFVKLVEKLSVITHCYQFDLLELNSSLEKDTPNLEIVT